MNNQRQQKIEDILEKVILQPWMTEKEYRTIVNQSIDNMGGWDEMDRQIEIGIENGYSFETQLKIIEKVLKELL